MMNSTINNKLLIIIIVIFLVFYNCNAQRISYLGLVGGYSCSKLYDNNIDLELNYKIGNQFGLVTDFRISSRLTW